MSVDEGDVPAVVFSGSYEEVIFLKSLLDSTDIEASIDNVVGGRYGELGFPTRLFVRQRDVEAAMELVEHFRKHGKRTVD